MTEVRISSLPRDRYRPSQARVGPDPQALRMASHSCHEWLFVHHDDKGLL